MISRLVTRQLPPGLAYEEVFDVDQDGTLTIPTGGTYQWHVLAHGADIGGEKSGVADGGDTLTVLNADSAVLVRRIS